METKGYVIIFGALFVFVALLFTGFHYHNNWVIAGGVIGIIVWFIGIFSLASAMNTDI